IYLLSLLRVLARAAGLRGHLHDYYRSLRFPRGHPLAQGGDRGASLSGVAQPGARRATGPKPPERGVASPAGSLAVTADRHSFLGAEPFFRMQAHGTRISCNELQGRHTETEHSDPLAFLAKQIRQYGPAPVAGLPRFTSGAVGYAAYDTVRYVEKLSKPPPD